MLFNSLAFLIFFPLVCLIYFIIPHRIRWVWLLVASYYFYMSWNPKYAILLAFTTVVTYLSGLLIESANGLADEKKARSLKNFYVFASFATNLGILFLFKYYGFFTAQVIKVFSWFNIYLSTPAFDPILPIGISFYTFQALTYTMDVYRKEAKLEKNIFKYALFVSFFPQILSGPIERAKNMLPQINEKHSFDYDRVKNGLLLMLWGFFQKIVIADRLAVLVNTVYNTPENYHGFEVIVATVFFAFQLYCDFSSYSNIARGAAQILGFDVMLNFKQPYFARSIQDFWRRWHISLSSWFRDYLYIPLGGNRCSIVRHYMNIMIVFLVSGLWHGAAITYVIWGGLHGLYQVISKVTKPLHRRLVEFLKINTEAFSYQLGQVLFTFLLVNFAWIFFRANSFSGALVLIKNIFYWNPWVMMDGTLFKLGLDANDFLLAILCIGLVLVVDLLSRRIRLRRTLAQQNILFRWGLYVTALVFLLVFGMYGPSFSAQEFIYLQF